MGIWQKLVPYDFIIGLKKQNVWSDLFVFLLVQGNTIWKVLREQNKSQDETSNRSRMSFTQKSSHYILTFSLVSTYTFQKFNICIHIPKRVLSYGIGILIFSENLEVVNMFWILRLHNVNETPYNLVTRL